MGGEVRPGATWVQASMEIDRLQGRPEGEHAGRLLAGRLPASEVADVLQVASAQRRQQIELPVRNATAVESTGGRDVSVYPAAGVAEVAEPVVDVDSHGAARPVASVGEEPPPAPDWDGGASHAEVIEDVAAPRNRTSTAEPETAEPQAVGRNVPTAGEPDSASPSWQETATGRKKNDEHPAAPISTSERRQVESHPAASAPSVDEPERRESLPASAERTEQNSAREAQKRALIQERESEAHRQAERDLDLGGMEL